MSEPVCGSPVSEDKADGKTDVYISDQPAGKPGLYFLQSSLRVSVIFFIWGAPSHFFKLTNSTLLRYQGCPQNFVGTYTK